MFSLVWVKHYQNCFYSVYWFNHVLSSTSDPTDDLNLLVLIKPTDILHFSPPSIILADLWHGCLSQRFFKFPALFPDICKISPTNWNNNSTNQSWWWTRPFPHNNPLHPFIYAQPSSLPILFLLPASHVQCTWIDSSLTSNSWTIFYQFNMICVCKLYRRILNVGKEQLQREKNKYVLLKFHFSLTFFRLKFSLTRSEIPWLFPDLEEFFFIPWTFPDLWEPCLRKQH